MPDIIVEDGTAPENANSYISTDDFELYAENNGYSLTGYTGTQVEAAVIRGRTALDALYGDRYPGDKTYGRDQSLLWPRAYAYDTDDYEIADDEIPTEIIQAQSEATYQELVSPNSMLPTLDRGGAIRSIKAGSVAIEYAGNASATATYSKIDGILEPLLEASSSSGFMMESERI